MIAGMLLASVPAGFLSLLVSSMLGVPAHLLILSYAAAGGAMMIVLALVAVAASARRL